MTRHEIHNLSSLGQDLNGLVKRETTLMLVFKQLTTFSRVSIPLLWISALFLLCSFCIHTPAIAAVDSQCGFAPDGWDLIKRLPHQRECADVIRSVSKEGNHILRIFHDGHLVVANDKAIPCHVCNLNAGMNDPLVDIAWDRNSLRVFNWFGTKEVSITETWTFEKADDRWTLGFWDRTLLEHPSGNLWGEFTNLRTGRIVAEYFGTGDDSCPLGTGCGDNNKEKPYKTSCTDQDLSSDIARISEYRSRELGCNIRYVIKKMIRHQASLAADSLKAKSNMKHSFVL